MIKIMIADDHPVVRYGVKNMLTQHKDLQVVGEASNATETVQLIVQLHPDILILDLEMDDCHGTEALERVRSVAEDIKIVIYTAYNDTGRIVEAMGLGVQGYLLKDSGATDLAKALRTVHAGGIFLEASVATRLVKGIHTGQTPGVEPLTPREHEVLRRMARGFRNQAIADALFISERTAKYHVSAILTKLGVDNRTEAVTVAIDLGILTTTLM